MGFNEFRLDRLALSIYYVSYIHTLCYGEINAHQEEQDQESWSPHFRDSQVILVQCCN